MIIIRFIYVSLFDQRQNQIFEISLDDHFDFCRNKWRKNKKGNSISNVQSIWKRKVKQFHLIYSFIFYNKLNHLYKSSIEYILIKLFVTFFLFFFFKPKNKKINILI